MLQNTSHVSSVMQKRIPVLDGLRFFAAFCVLLGHYSAWVLGDQGVNNAWTRVLQTLPGIGMPLFFVLSGFVIHYNYSHIYTTPGGIKSYLIARFTRLYPLYIVIFAIEFFISFHLWRGSCGHAGERWGFLLALPYYLTLTQDWVYGIIANNNLIYQYHMMSAVAWSISLEFFFYLFYLVMAKRLNTQSTVFRNILLIVISQLVVIAFILFCHRYEALIDKAALVGFGKNATVANGYQDSLLRWLYYFNPLVNVPAFIMGALSANLYHILKDKPLHRIEQLLGSWLTALSLIAALALHFWLYLSVSYHNGFIGKTASLLTVPLIAVLIFSLTRYSASIVSRLLSWSLLVKLGEASYSIYLLHAFFGWYSRDFYYLNLNPWVLFMLAIGCILVISRCSYVLFERPVQRWLRNRMMGKKPNPSISTITAFN